MGVFITPGQKDRTAWVDIAKGLGMIAVVVGHSGSSIAHFMYWFHMPLFFIISGYLFKPLSDWTTLYSWVKKRARQMLIPYVSFLGVLVIVEFYLNNRYFNLHEIIQAFFVNLFPGGRYIGGFFTPFWFITCFFMTQIVFAVILKAFKTTWVQLSIIGAAYLLAHLEAGVLQTRQILIPWDIDVVLLTITYHAIGYYGRKLLSNMKPLLAYSSIILSILLLAGAWFGLISYSMNMKYLTCDHIILDIIVPVVITVAILAISQKFASVKWSKHISILGVYSLPIMYLHLPFNIVIHEYIDNGVALFVLAGLILPVVCSRFIFERLRITQVCLLGQLNQSKHSQSQLLAKNSVA